MTAFVKPGAGTGLVEVRDVQPEMTPAEAKSLARELLVAAGAAEMYVRCNRDRGAR